MDQPQHRHRELTLWSIHLHTNPASATLWTPHACVRSMSMHCQSKPQTYTKLVVNLFCAFVHVPICDLMLCLLSSLLPPFSFPLYFLMLFTTSLAIVQHSNLSVSLLINPNDVSCPGFLFDLIYVLVNRNFRSFHSIAFRVTTFIRGIRALKDSLQGTFVYSHE